MSVNTYPLFEPEDALLAVVLLFLLAAAICVQSHRSRQEPSLVAAGTMGLVIATVMLLTVLCTVLRVVGWPSSLSILLSEGEQRGPTNGQTSSAPPSAALTERCS